MGPRPEQPHYVEELTDKIPFYDLRHLVRPGLTGWAQVKFGYAGDEHDALEKLQYDFFYLQRQTLGLDVAHRRPHVARRLHGRRTMTRRVAVFSVTRADLWPLTPLLREMVADERLTPTLLATGTHLSSAYGSTLQEIGEWIDVVPIDARLTADDSPAGLLAAARREAEGVAGVLDAARPDLLVLLGDRYELLGVAQAALPACPDRAPPRG